MLRRFCRSSIIKAQLIALNKSAWDGAAQTYILRLSQKMLENVTNRVDRLTVIICNNSGSNVSALPQSEVGFRKIGAAQGR